MEEADNRLRAESGLAIKKSGRSAIQAAVS
jgi:hypothetical protein